MKTPPREKTQYIVKNIHLCLFLKPKWPEGPYIANKKKNRGGQEIMTVVTTSVPVKHLTATNCNAAALAKSGI